MTKLLRCIASLLMFAATSIPAAAAPHQSWARQALASAAPYIDRANSDWAKAIVTGNASVMSAPYDIRGIMIGPNGSVFRGRDAVKRMYASRHQGLKVLKASIRSDGRAAHDPDDVYEWGTAWLTIRADNVVRKRSGKYLTVWHREDKRWVITRNIAF